MAPKEKKILYIDLDNVSADFSNSPKLNDWTDKARNPSAMFEKGFFLDLVPIPGAMAAIRELIDCDLYDIYILTKPVSNSPRSYSEKASWVLSNLPELKDKIVMAQNKGLLKGDILIDDSKSWQKSFEGEFIWFDSKSHPLRRWQTIVEDLTTRGDKK